MRAGIVDGQSQATVRLSVGRRNRVSSRHTAIRVAAVPAAAATNARRGVYGTHGVDVGRVAVAVGQVLAPLEHVTAHVIQTQLVGLAGGNAVGAVVAA